MADRARPDYDALGTQVGAFTVFPTITGTAEATDNYLATDTNRRGDAYFTIQPEAYIRSDWARNRIDARLFVSQSVHASLGGENVTQYGITSSGAYEPMRDTQFTANAAVSRNVESRSSLGAFQGSVEPVHYYSYHGGVGASHIVNDLTLTANAGIDYRDYADTRFANGTIIDQTYRNVRDVTVGGSAQYNLRNGIGLIVSGSYDTERYDLRPGSAGFIPGINIDRDSSGFNIQGGVTLELSHLIFGSLQIGYLNRNYVDPTLNDFGGLSFSGDVLWNVTTLTSLRFRASRSVQDTSSALIAGNTRSDFSVSVDHELYRYVIVSGNVSYGRFRPNGVGIGGDEYGVGANVRYLINRRFSVIGGVRYNARTSDSTFLRYTAITGNLGLRAAF